jgi:hypothetical protein
MYEICVIQLWLIFITQGVSKTPDSVLNKINFEDKRKNFLTLSGTFHDHENLSQSLLFEYNTL